MNDVGAAVEAAEGDMLKSEVPDLDRARMITCRRWWKQERLGEYGRLGGQRGPHIHGQANTAWSLCCVRENDTIFIVRPLCCLACRKAIDATSARYPINSVALKFVTYQPIDLEIVSDFRIV